MVFELATETCFKKPAQSSHGFVLNRNFLISIFFLFEICDLMHINMLVTFQHLNFTPFPGIGRHLSVNRRLLII